jgi:hypothetical protein
VRMYLARAMEGSLIGFIVSGVFISILWYPALWIMVAFVVALRNISETQSEGAFLRWSRQNATGVFPSHGSVKGRFLVLSSCRKKSVGIGELLDFRQM